MGNTKTITENLYNFYAPPAKGYMKEILSFHIGIKDGNLFLINNSKESLFFRIKEIDKPYLKEGKMLFVIKALYIPILFSLIMFVAGAQMLFNLNVKVQIIGGVIALVFLIDLATVVWKLRGYKSGMKRIVKYDRNKIWILIVGFIGLFAFASKLDAIGYIELTSIFMMALAYIVFLETIKKQLFILLSENVMYWRYMVEAAEGKTLDFVLVSEYFEKKELE